MIVGGVPLLLKKSGNVIEEDWANLDAWDLNQYQTISIIAMSGSSATSSNRIIVSSYGSGLNRGPHNSIDIEPTTSFTITTDVEITNTTASQAGYVTVGLGDSAQPSQDNIQFLLFDSSGSNTTTFIQLRSYLSGSFTSRLSQSNASTGTYNVSVSLTRQGDDFDWEISGDFTGSGSFTWSGVTDFVFVNFFNGSGVSNTEMPVSAGPLTLEYS